MRQSLYGYKALLLLNDDVKNTIRNICYQKFYQKDALLKETYYSNLIENNLIFKDFADWKNQLINHKDTLWKYNVKNAYLLTYEGLEKISHKQLNNYPLSIEILLKFHQWVMGGARFGGYIREENNVIIDSQTKKIIYQPPKWIKVLSMLKTTIKHFNQVMKKIKAPEDKFILVIKLMFDFLCIHPFSDGNGRVSRLLFYWLIIKYEVIKDFQISISYRIWNNLQKYYASLRTGNKNWNTDNENIVRLIKYFVKLLKEDNEKRSKN